MSSRKLEALRRLAERPGTVHEGIVAREMLAKLEAKHPKEARRMLVDEEFPGYKMPNSWKCACGAEWPLSMKKCGMGWFHTSIRESISRTFKKGDRVYYNFHAYPKNCPGTISGFVKQDAPENGSHPWAWVRIKFDHLKSARAVPIYYEGRCGLTHQPIIF